MNREDADWEARIEMETDAAYDEHETHEGDPDPDCWLCDRDREEEAS